MKYVYPAIFHEEDNAVLVDIPDLPGAHTFGKNLPEALEMARDAIEVWLVDREDEKGVIPTVSNVQNMKHDYRNGFISYVAADTDEWRRKFDAKAVKKTLSIPSWLNYQAEQANAPFSQILQQGLKEYLRIT